VVASLFLGCKDVNEFIDKAMEEALEENKGNKGVMLMNEHKWVDGWIKNIKKGGLNET